MPKVVVERNDLRIEADLSFEQIKELIGVNGYRRLAVNVGAPAASVAPATSTPPRSAPTPIQRLQAFQAFHRILSERGQKFIHILRLNENGIEANQLAQKLGFTEAKQIGGLTGGGVAKAARKTNVPLQDVYRTDITTIEGKRTVMFYPGSLILETSRKEEKPA